MMKKTGNVDVCNHNVVFIFQTYPLFEPLSFCVLYNFKLQTLQRFPPWFFFCSILTFFSTIFLGIKTFFSTLLSNNFFFTLDLSLI